ncbi:RNA-directed DNA polymerase, eukaryota, reverse transcriptase zinc-binding domain protein [Tanacetum coccineum]
MVLYRYNFVAGRHILDGPFILDELLQWCKRRSKNALFFKVDFAKAYDSIRWDYLLDVLDAFGFGNRWCKWIRGSLMSATASILVNGSPSNEFVFHCGLKQGDPLAPYLFILIMETLHLSFCRVVDSGLFKGIHFPGSLAISHLFYADDTLFVGEWSNTNLEVIINVLRCFFAASGLSINIQKCQLLGVGVSQDIIVQAASAIGCSIMHSQFRYLGVSIGDRKNRLKAWESIVSKLRNRLSKWKEKTLSIGGRLTLLKAVLGASPVYSMSLFKVPLGVLNIMEGIRNRFFNGNGKSESKITWIAWNKVLASKKNGGLGVSSFFALNRALLFKWIWRFISKDGSLWSRVIQAIYGTRIDEHPLNFSSNWCAIVNEVRSLNVKGIDLWSHCRKRIGNGRDTSFWLDCWLDSTPLSVMFPRVFALEEDKDVSVAVKLGSSVCSSFRRDPRGGIEHQQMMELQSLLETVSLSNSKDRWIFDLTGDGVFSVKALRNFIDDKILPSHPEATNWVKNIPIKVNIFNWRARRDCLPTRLNLAYRGVVLESTICPVCKHAVEDIKHILFRCDLARSVLRRVCRWWGLDQQDWSSFLDWHNWFSSTRLPSANKELLEGVFYTAWWILWNFRNKCVFQDNPPRRSTLFDDLVLCAFNWCHSRCNRKFNWIDWLKNPHLISL